MVDAIHTAIAEDSHFVRCIRQLTEEDRLTLERIMGELHAQLDRDFVHVHR